MTTAASSFPAEIRQKHGAQTRGYCRHVTGGRTFCGSSRTAPESAESRRSSRGLPSLDSGCLMSSLPIAAKKHAARWRNGLDSIAVFDSSAILAVIFNEPGGETVIPLLQGALLSTVNLAEVHARLLLGGSSSELAWNRLLSMGCEVCFFDDTQARLAAEMSGRRAPTAFPWATAPAWPWPSSTGPRSTPPTVPGRISIWILKSK